MLDQLKQFKQMMDALGDPQELRAKAERMKTELEAMTVTGEAGAGAVRVTANGSGAVLDLTLDPAMIATLAGGSATDADQQMIQDLIIAATNDALDRARQQAAQHMSQLTAGMNLPGMDQLGSLLNP